MDIETLAIDAGALDREWHRQPSLCAKYAEDLANARKELAEAQANEELVIATVKRKVRADPTKYKILVEKPTEGAINEAVAVNLKVLGAAKDTREAKFKVDLLAGIMTAVDHRKKALENLVNLHGMSYFSTPKTKNKDVSDQLRMAEKKNRLKLKKKGQ